jgi:hypothetical protein
MPPQPISECRRQATKVKIKFGGEKRGYAAISSFIGGGTILVIFLGTSVLLKKAEHLLLFSKGQSMIFQQGVNLSNFLTAFILIPCS